MEWLAADLEACHDLRLQRSAAALEPGAVMRCLQMPHDGHGPWSATVNPDRCGFADGPAPSAAEHRGSRFVASNRLLTTTGGYCCSCLGLPSAHHHDPAQPSALVHATACLRWWKHAEGPLS